MTLTSDLTIAIGDVATRVTPNEGLRLAERLIKMSMTRMVQIAAEDAVRNRYPAQKQAL